MPSPAERLAAALAERYRLERTLGRGGMATVYLAQDLRHARKVAIKVLRPDLAVAIGERFLREIQTIANLQHPHILGLIDSGQTDDASYYVMPFVDGESLRDRLDREKQLPVPDAVRITCEVASALDYAHRHGVVHRDLKPENILLNDGQALVADFGIALDVSSTGPTRITETGVRLGTPLYMSPEQITGDRAITPRSDIYALGAVTYEMLLGEPPFTGASTQAVMAKVFTQKPVSLVIRRDTVTEALNTAVLRALERLPADRFTTAAEFGAAVGAAVSSMRPNGSAPSVAVIDRPLTTSRFRLSETTCRRLSRAAFDPRLIGSEMTYLDNGVASNVLVCYIAACGRGGDQFSTVLQQSPYHGVAPTLCGFQPTTDWRPAFSINDHIVLVRECLRDIVAKTKPRVVVVAGFSSGGDFAIRFAASPDPDARLALDGCLTLGANLSSDTCFLTRALSSLKGADDLALLAVLRNVSDRASSLDEWVNICEYVVKIVPAFRHDVTPLQTFAADISAPFAAESLGAFAAWYRSAAARGCHLRCVFEDSGMYRNLVRELQLKNIDDGLLGDQYQEASVISEAGTGHFDLIDPARVARHLDALVYGIGERGSGRFGSQ